MASQGASLDMPIHYINVKASAISALKRAGIHTLADMGRTSADQLRYINGMTAQNAREVATVMQLLGRPMHPTVVARIQAEIFQ